MFRNLKIQRLIACTLIVTFTNLTLYPMAASAQGHLEKT